MNTSTDFDRHASAWLADGPTELSDRVLDAALREIHLTPQRHRWSTPWNTTLRSFRLTAAALIAIVALAGAVALGTLSGGVDSQPTPTPTTTSSIAPSSWTPFTSARHGINLRFPPGWTVTAATAPWTWQDVDPGPTSEATDRAVSATNQGFVVASQKLPAGMTEAMWWADYLATDTTGMPLGCFPTTRADYEQVSVDGRPAFLHGGIGGCNFIEVVAVIDGRAYQLTAYENVEFPTGGIFDRRLFDAWLATVRFDPPAADDAPVEASPGPS